VKNKELDEWMAELLVHARKTKTNIRRTQNRWKIYTREKEIQIGDEKVSFLFSIK
jgi:hypothetical protein